MAYWFLYHIPMTSVNWGNRSRNPQHKLLRMADGTIPVFTTLDKARLWQAGHFRPSEDEVQRSRGGRGIRRNTPA